MKNLFDTASYNEIMQRLSSLAPASERQWGKMSVAQMLAHCKEAFRVPLSEKSPPKIFPLYLIGWMVKKQLYDDKPWKQSLPTSPNFKIKDERDFEIEKAELTALVSRFHQTNPAAIEKIVHPVFGKYTGQQWGQSMYKHLDHHLRQFGV